MAGDCCVLKFLGCSVAGALNTHNIVYSQVQKMEHEGFEADKKCPAQTMDLEKFKEHLCNTQ